FSSIHCFWPYSRATPPRRKWLPLWPICPMQAPANRKRRISCGRSTTRSTSPSTTKDRRTPAMSRSTPEVDKFNKFIEKHPHHHQTFFNRPHLTRRHFFE